MQAIEVIGDAAYPPLEVANCDFKFRPPGSNRSSDDL